MTKPGKNVFDLSHDVKLSLNMGELVPTLCQELVPGDKFQIGCDALVRMAPLVAPMMHRVDFTMHYFFVPNRILWSNWENFITNSEVSGAVPAFPYIPVQFATFTQLQDYMGLSKPTGAGTFPISALPFAAYQRIYNDYYRDENLIAPAIDTLIDGNNNVNYADLCALRNRAWEHDYFTAALPFAQKGNAVDIPLGNVAQNVEVKVNEPSASPYTDLTGVPTDVSVNADPTTDLPSSLLYAETRGLDIEPTTINDLRRAFKLQEWLEKNARGGTRYTENIRAHFGVTSSDARLQRAEYITGVKTPVIISEVLNTGGDSATLPQGNMAGHGAGVANGHYGSYFAEEHGYIIGIMSVMPKTAYQQGIPRHFLKVNDFTEYYWPSFANLGEQPIYQEEVYSDALTQGETFGYIPRYAEYKFSPNRVAGEFKTTLDYWHMGRIFTSAPALNQAFVESNPTHRVFAVTDPTQDKLYCQVLHKIKAIRPMPKFGTPTF